MLQTPRPLSSLALDEQEYSPAANFGQYIAFTLDAATTLSQHADMDDIAIEEAKAIPAKQYVGQVTLSGQPPSDRLAALWITLLPISPSLPPFDPENFVEPHMCTPILPTTQHPNKREAISTTRPLPWPVVYHPSYLQFRVLAKSQYMPKPLQQFHMGVDESWELECHIGKDLDVREIAWHESGQPAPELLSLHPEGCLFEEPKLYPSLHPLLGTDFPTEIFLSNSGLDHATESVDGMGELYEDDSDGEEGPPSCNSYSSTQHSIMSGPDHEEDDDLPGSILRALQSVASLSERVYDSDPIVSVVYDLTTVPELVDPLGFLLETKELNAIMHRSRDRAYERLKKTLSHQYPHESCLSRTSSRVSRNGSGRTGCTQSVSVEAGPFMLKESIHASENYDLPPAAPSCFGFLTSWFKARIQPRLPRWSFQARSSSSTSSTMVSEKDSQPLSAMKRRLPEPSVRRRRLWRVNRRLRLDFDATLS